MPLLTTPWKYGKDVAFYTKIRYTEMISRENMVIEKNRLKQQ